MKVQSLEASISANEDCSTTCSSSSSEAGKVIGGFIGGCFLAILAFTCYRWFKDTDKRSQEIDDEKTPVGRVD